MSVFMFRFVCPPVAPVIPQRQSEILCAIWEHGLLAVTFLEPGVSAVVVAVAFPEAEPVLTHKLEPA